MSTPLALPAGPTASPRLSRRGPVKSLDLRLTIVTSSFGDRL